MDYTNLQANQEIDENGMVYELNSLYASLDWPKVGQAFRLEREVWHARYQGRTHQVVCSLTSLFPHKASAQKVVAFKPPILGH